MDAVDAKGVVNTEKTRFDFAKIAFYTTTACTALGLSFALGLYSGAKETVVLEVAKYIYSSLDTVIAEISTLAGTNPKHFLQPARYDGKGVTLNGVVSGRDELILLSGFFEDTNELRLIRRDGELVARWPVRFSEIFPDSSHMSVPPATDWNIDTHGALALPEGSVVFNFEYGGLVKLDRCGAVVWTVPEETHHSVELAEEGGFWVPGRRHFSSDEKSPLPPFETPFREDTILKLSDSGEVLDEISVAGLFYENGLEALLTATGYRFKTGMKWDREILHLNKVEELTSDIAGDFPMFDAGDLALSIRDYNLVMVFDPDTRRIKWWQTGPWLRQHDPEFRPGGTIVVFNNNTYRTALVGNEISPLSAPRVSNIVESDPVSGKYRTIYGGTKDQELLSVLRGKVEVVPSGGVLITEFEGGRVIETDTGGRKVWEYINRYSSEEVAEITEARSYPASYFNVSDWSCPRVRES